jgi:hypothetical protein
MAAGAAAAERMRVKSTGDFQFNSGYGSVATAYGCRAWVNFDGTGTPAIRASGNVSSITDNGTGDYTVNFTNSMPDVNYASALASEVQTTFNISSKAASNIRVICRTVGGSGIDVAALDVSVFR